MEQEGSNKRPISARKLEANQRNAQNSTGPRTEAGKAKSATNSYKHGLFSSRLFPTRELKQKDEPVYLEIIKGLSEEYQPVGYIEGVLVERIATEMLRYVRLLGHEQGLIGSAPGLYYEARSSTTLLRYLATVNKQISQLTEQLEKRQAARKENEEGAAVCGNPAEEAETLANGLNTDGEDAPTVEQPNGDANI